MTTDARGLTDEQKNDLKRLYCSFDLHAYLQSGEIREAQEAILVDLGFDPVDLETNRPAIIAEVQEDIGATLQHLVDSMGKERVGAIMDVWGKMESGWGARMQHGQRIGDVATEEELVAALEFCIDHGGQRAS